MIVFTRPGVPLQHSRRRGRKPPVKSERKRLFRGSLTRERAAGNGCSFPAGGLL